MISNAFLFLAFCRLSCNKPLRVIGVQEETPLAWSPDGKFLAFASGNRSIYILSRGQNGQYDVDSVLIGHVLKVGNRVPFQKVRI